MGNCAVKRPSQKKHRAPTVDEGQQELKPSNEVGKIAFRPYQRLSNVPRKKFLVDANRKSGKVYCLSPGEEANWICGSSTSQKMEEDDGCRGRIVKIVVTRQQLELLTSGAKELRCSRMAFQFSRAREKCQKWRPSLATISEL